MTWIHNHTKHYIVPGIFALAAAYREKQAEPRYWKMLDVNVVDAVRQAKNIRPAHGWPNKEIGLIWSALKSCGYSEHVPQTTWRGLRNSHVGEILPERAYSIGDVQADDSIHNIVKNSTKTLRRILKKDPRRRLILPGRDVWLWSVACHRAGIEHVFDARISRKVARQPEVLKKIVRGWRVNKHTVIFDTGFAGSIYECICEVSRKKPINLMLSTHRKGEQIYPNHKRARGKALSIEYLPKYQKTGTVRNGEPIQWLANLDEYIKAALLTIWFWYNESPAWIDQGGERCKVVDCFCKSCRIWKKGAKMPG